MEAFTLKKCIYTGRTTSSKSLGTRKRLDQRSSELLSVHPRTSAILYFPLQRSNTIAVRR